MKKKSMIMTILFVVLLPLLWLAVHTNNEPPTPIQEKNMEVLKAAEPDDLIICHTPGNLADIKNVKIALLVLSNSGTKLYGDLITRRSVRYTGNGIYYDSFMGCEVLIQRYAEIRPELIGRIILYGLPLQQ